MAAPKHIIVTDDTGDGGFLRHLPAAVRARLRPLAMRTPRHKEQRLMRVAEAIYPELQAIEALAVAESQRLLAGRDLAAALRDDRVIERALTLFDVAWQTGLTELSTQGKNSNIGFGNKKAVLGACGLTVAEGQQFFLRAAVRVIFRQNKLAYEKLEEFVDDKTSLPRMRLLASVDALALSELQTGWGKHFHAMLTAKDDEFIIAIRQLRPFQARSVRQVMQQQFADTLHWTPEMWTAIAESFQCVEQFRDLGDYFLDLKDPEAVRAIGRWERQDITEKVNADRRKQGKKPVKGRRWETDISHIRRMIGTNFTDLVQRDAGVIDLYGEIYASRIKPLEEPARGQAVEQIQLLSRRYLEYMTGPMLQVLLHPSEDDDFTLTEVISVLEGLWMKGGLGSGFFEGSFQTEEGVEGIRGLALEYVDMKRRGSAKQGTDVAALIQNSDLFDRFLVPLMKKKSKAGG
jgi:hypothetical protein